MNPADVILPSKYLQNLTSAQRLHHSGYHSDPCHVSSGPVRWPATWSSCFHPCFSTPYNVLFSRQQTDWGFYTCIAFCCWRLWWLHRTFPKSWQRTAASRHTVQAHHPRPCLPDLIHCLSLSHFCPALTCFLTTYQACSDLRAFAYTVSSVTMLFPDISITDVLIFFSIYLNVI